MSLFSLMLIKVLVGNDDIQVREVMNPEYGSRMALSDLRSPLSSKMSLFCPPEIVIMSRLLNPEVLTPDAMVGLSDMVDVVR